MKKYLASIYLVLILSGCSSVTPPENFNNEVDQATLNSEVGTKSVDVNTQDDPEIQTVEGILNEYYTVSQALSADALSVHEQMCSIYYELNSHVSKGQGNTEKMHLQMKLLSGKVRSANDMKEWIDKNRGFFVVDNDGNGADLINIFDALHARYDELSDENKLLIEADWDSGSVFVKPEDVNPLAEAMDISRGTLQHAFDVISTYSSYPVD